MFDNLKKAFSNVSTGFSEKDLNEKDIEVANLVDHIDGYNKELIITDRRIFLDDRKDKEELDYGMVYLTK